MPLSKRVPSTVSSSIPKVLDSSTLDHALFADGVYR
jgi:hypothetical protein